jgi:hypothetical protein
MNEPMAGFVQGCALVGIAVGVAATGVGIALSAAPLMLGGFAGVLVCYGLLEWMGPYRDFRDAPQMLEEDGGDWVWPNR